MKPKSYETLLKEMAAPPPEAQARVLARRAALQEFARVQAANAAPSKPGFFQGLLGALRLSRETQSHGSDVMGLNAKSRMFAAAAGVCVAVIGLAVIWPMVKGGDSARLLEKTPAESMTVEPVRSEAPASEPAASTGTRSEAHISPDAAATPAQQTGQQTLAVGEAKKRRATEQSERPGPTVTGEQEKLKASPAEAAPETIVAEDIGQFPDVSASQALQSAPVVIVAGQPAATAPSPQQRSEADSISEVVVTGVHGQSRASATPHKGVAAPMGMGGSAGKQGQESFYGRQSIQLEPKIAEPFDEGRDKFEHFDLNAVKQVADDPVSTFSADVDSSSYSFVRRQLNAGILPQKDAVRSEEMINYFDYSWPAAESRERPFRPTVVVSDSPWGKGRKLIHIGIKGYELDARQRPDANLVLLLDVSGSMSTPDKLPLVKESMRMMVNGLKATDTVAIVVYAGAAGMVLPPTPVGEKEKILAALDSLSPGGSTAGAEGIELAYQLAEHSFRKEGVNRILLCTDGDFNVGIDDTNQLKGFIERKRAKGIFLSVLGFGQGNYRDELAQALAQNGNGVAAYIDTLSEAQKVLVQEAGASLFTIAKDVKLQVEFNPAAVAEYRLVGYETRALKREDFNNDAVDAGDVGSGHSVTAIYEITPVGVDSRMIEPSRYAKEKAPVVANGKAGEYGFLRIRYKLPASSKSQLIERPINIESGSDQAPATIARDVQFSTAVAGFAQLLRGGQYTGSLNYDDVVQQALAARGDDPFGYRNEFVQLVRRAQTARGQ
jgi:Ca-activated chloride channel homolog